MKYLYKFNESNKEFDINDYDDYLYSIAEREPDDKVIQNNWIFCVYSDNSNIISNNIKNSERFKDVKVMIDIDHRDVLYVMIINPIFYRENFKYSIENIVWKKHYLAQSIEGNSEEMQKLMLKTNIGKSEQVSGMPENISIIRGLHIYDDHVLEMWIRDKMEDPKYYYSMVDIQREIYDTCIEG